MTLAGMAESVSQNCDGCNRGPDMIRVFRYRGGRLAESGDNSEKCSHICSHVESSEKRNNVTMRLLAVSLDSASENSEASARFRSVM